MQEKLLSLLLGYELKLPEVDWKMIDLDPLLTLAFAGILGVVIGNRVLERIRDDKEKRKKKKETHYPISKLID